MAVDETNIDAPVEGFDNGRPPFSDASIVDVLKEEARELAEARECFIPVKGYGKTGLQVSYHLPENGKELDNIARKVMREDKDTYYRNLNTAVDTMIHLCSGLYVQPPDVPEPVMLDPQETGSPVFFDSRLAELLGMEQETPSARSVVKKLFGNNEMAIIAHAEKLSRWLQDTKADLTVELWQLGEA